MQNDGIQFLSVEEAIAIHERLIERFGGSAGIRDRGLLESALFRPQTGHYNDIAELAAALFESLLLNHAFVDGYKRDAFFVTDVFLRLNGWQLMVDAASAHTFIVGMLERGDCSYEKLLPWIRESLRQLWLLVGVAGFELDRLKAILSYSVSGPIPAISRQVRHAVDPMVPRSRGIRCSRAVRR